MKVFKFSELQIAVLLKKVHSLRVLHLILDQLTVQCREPSYRTQHSRTAQQRELCSSFMSGSWWID
jgi:hypothetical protein